MNTPTPEQLRKWREKFLSEDGYTPEVAMPDAHNYKRVLQDARFDGYLRAKAEMLEHPPAPRKITAEDVTDEMCFETGEDKEHIAIIVNAYLTGTAT